MPKELRKNSEGSPKRYQALAAKKSEALSSTHLNTTQPSQPLKTLKTVKVGALIRVVLRTLLSMYTFPLVRGE
jgi:hypothetical protein